MTNPRLNKGSLIVPVYSIVNPTIFFDRFFKSASAGWFLLYAARNECERRGKYRGSNDAETYGRQVVDDLEAQNRKKGPWNFHDPFQHYKVIHEVVITDFPFTKNEESTFSIAGNKYTNKNRSNKNSVKNNCCASGPDDTKHEFEAAENIKSSVSQKKASASNRKEANELFEHLWAFYSSKRGKGQVSD